jgi:hypothetical protein
LVGRNEDAVRTVRSQAVKPGYQSRAWDGSQGRADVLTIDVPSVSSATALTDVHISDDSAGYNPCIFVLGLTVEVSV